MITEELRSYEVSLWTLQDEFITVLKWSDVEQKGRIQDPHMKLNVDGTQNFTFSIPMYLYVEELDEDFQHVKRMKKIENPIWYNTQNGNLMVGLNKIKVIFNKGEFDLQDASDYIFEFLITKVTESHDNEQLKCDIECEGLAFHELGKIGYKISLSQDTFILDKKDYDETGSWTKRNGDTVRTDPIENVQYWSEQCGLEPTPVNEGLMIPSVWYYSIQMNWGSFKTPAQSGASRASNTVYENEFVNAWSDDGNLTPLSITAVREKARPIDVKESNIYNITQTIAEAFEIYCRYKYRYDDNYHIIGREVIYYNNYLNEDNVQSFTYPYLTSQITREMDVTDITTKMYVQSQQDPSIVSGEITIADCVANKTKEDYLLNFDYLHLIGAITEEQYNEIPIFEKNVRALNLEIESLGLEINALQKEETEQKALAAVYEQSIALDTERLSSNSALYNKLDANDGQADGCFTRGTANPYSTYVKTGKDGRRYIELSDENKGVIENTILVFRVYNSAKQTFKNRISAQDYNVIRDEYGYIKELVLPGFKDSFTTGPHPITVTMGQNGWNVSTNDNITDNQVTGSNSLVYLLYKYQPSLYYEAVNQIWLKKQSADKADYNTAVNRANTATTARLALEQTYKQKIAEKDKLVQKFERMMGPALREGYWQPESYTDYGNSYTHDLTLTTYDTDVLIDDTDLDAAIGWDETLFDDEGKLYFEESVLREHVFYPCIKLVNGSNYNLRNLVCGWLQSGLRPSFIFNTNYYRDLTGDEINAAQNLQMFTLGGSMILGFIHEENASNVVPVLILTGTSEMTNEQIKFMITKGNPRLGVSDVNVNNQNVASISFSDDTTDLQVDNFYWTEVGTNISSCSIVYPRIKISSNDLHTSSVVLKAGNNLLTNYTDYQTISRTTIRDDLAFLEYFITIKPETFFKYGSYINNFTIGYTLSNAATSIYLDAQDVMLDSSKPKVSYTIKVSALNTDYIKEAYKSLTQLVMVNDTELKFENVFGYISELDLNLDAPWEDTIEVKNYKTKFEDLFSTIVASSEAMQRNGAAFNAAATGGIPLNAGALDSMLKSNSLMLSNYLDSLLNTSAAVKAMLAELFTEAGTILAAADESLDELNALNIKNSSILAGFMEEVSTNLTPTVVASKNQPTNFKVGDVWVELDDDGNVIGRRIATTSSNESSGGYTRTFDGSLAAIKGSALNIDAVAGTMEILAENRIDMKSGGNIYIAANETVEIVGNKSVNIGGTTINIGTETVNNETVQGGVNIVATSYDGDFKNAQVARVKIEPEQILMAGSEIKMLTGTANTAVSAVRIGGASGIWLGSTAGITLYSGNLNAANPSGASVEIKNNYLLFGVSNSNSGAAIKLTNEALTLAVGTSGVNNIETQGISGVTGGKTGVRITNEFFGIAATVNNVMNAVIINDRGITLGSGVGVVQSLGQADVSNASGSVVRISGTGIVLNSSANLSVNTGNVIINSSPTNTVFKVRGTNKDGTASAQYLQYSDGALTITGKLTATELYVGSGNNSLTYNGSTLTLKGSMTVSEGSTIAGWIVEDTHLNSANGSVALFSSGTDAIKCGDNFVATFNGDVYLNALMVLDNDGVINAAHSTRGNDSYARIDFSRLNFSNALALSLGVSGSNIVATAKFLGVWDAQPVSRSLTVSAADAIGVVSSPDELLMPIADVSITIDIKIGNDVINDVQCTGLALATGPVMKGWNGACDEGKGWVGAVLDPGEKVSITVPVKGTLGSSKTFTISAKSTCFSGDTKITMADGTETPIKLLRVGEQLLTYDEINHEQVTTEIVFVKKYNTSVGIAEIYLPNNKSIIFTKNHTLLTDNGWKALDVEGALRENPNLEITLLTKEDKLIDKNGNTVDIIDIVDRPELDGIPVYNIDVEPYDTYLAEGIVAHNPDPGLKS